MVAVVRAAHDWRRTGLMVPIQRDDLFGLFKRHFEHLEPAQDATEEVFKAALEDAGKPVVRYRTLLLRDCERARFWIGTSSKPREAAYLRKEF